MSIVERLLEDSKEIWETFYTHPFVQGIGSGSLDHEKFKYYMIQDYLYLIDYAKVFAVGAAKAFDMDTMREFSAYTDSLMNGEMEIHRSYMKRLGITEEEAEHCPAALDNISYTSYMLRIAYEGGPADVMAAILSCALSYEEIACRLKAQYPGCWEHPFFGEWVSGYISEEYHEANQKLIALMERLADGFDERQIAKTFGSIQKLFPLRSRFLGYGLGDEEVNAAV